MRKAIIKATILYIVLLTLFPFGTNASSTQYITFQASSDSSVIEGDSTNYGATTTLAISETEDFYIMFDVSALDSQAIIQSASVILNQSSYSGDPVSVQVYEVTSSWSETSISGVNKPSVDTGSVLGSLSASSTLGNKTTSISELNVISRWKQNPASNFGLYFTTGSTGVFSHEFSSKEGINTPTITIGYTLGTDIEEGPVISEIKILEITQNSATIGWTTDKEGSSYVQYGTDEDVGSETGVDTLGIDHEVMVGNLVPSTLHYFKVKSLDSDGNSSVSELLQFTTLAEEKEEEKPVVQKSDQSISEDIVSVKDLKGVFEKEGSFVYLTWGEPEDQEVTGYKIYRSEGDSVSYVMYAEIDAGASEYKDTEVTEGKTYYYVVRVVFGEKESKDSNDVKVSVGKSRIIQELENLNFWNGFLILNVVFVPVFVVWYVLYKKKNKKGKKKKRGKRM